MTELNKTAFETQAIRQNWFQSQANEHSQGIFLTSSFTFENAKMAADIFAERIETFSYSRFTNPTVQMFEKTKGEENNLNDRRR